MVASQIRSVPPILALGRKRQEESATRMASIFQDRSDLIVRGAWIGRRLENDELPTAKPQLELLDRVTNRAAISGSGAEVSTGSGHRSEHEGLFWPARRTPKSRETGRKWLPRVSLPPVEMLEMKERPAPRRSGPSQDRTSNLIHPKRRF